MSGFQQSRREVVRNIADNDEIASGTITNVDTQVKSTPVTSSSTKNVTPTVSIQDRTTFTSSSQHAWPWQGGRTPGAGPWSGLWGGTPTTIITLASTVTYTDPGSTAKVSQSSSIDPTASEFRNNGLDISGPAAAGIGIGASVGLLGLCLAVVYFYRMRSRRPRHQSSAQTLGSDKPGDGVWPPYPYSASNESPVELSATLQPKEMYAETRSREKDASSDSEIVELEGEGLVVREARATRVKNSRVHRKDTDNNSGHGLSKQIRS
ncbi:hypothetical protein F5Y03DRAFT_356156 [Xylaria venustula]|nr:hypothetical protein F5Y03DRAFT_356156 [Xylaria venustula]